MQLSEKWPRVCVGNYPTLILLFASVKVHLICNQMQKNDEKRPQGSEKIMFLVFYI